jgi:hypothetical protein
MKIFFPGLFFVFFIDKKLKLFHFICKVFAKQALWIIFIFSKIENPDQEHARGRKIAF